MEIISENKDRVLIIKSDRDEFEQYYINNMQREYVDTYSFYKVNKGIGWKIATLWIQKLNIPGQSYWYGSWKKNIRKYKTIVLFDNNLSWNIIEYIRRKNKKCRIIIWYWNPIKENKRIKDLLNKHCELWSFDDNDCERYSINKNTQFYVKNDKNIDNKVDIEYDAVFIGGDKGRLHKILEIKQRLENLGYKAYVYVVGNENNICTNTKRIKYRNVIEFIQKSECIIDIPQEGQSGMTIRGLEAIFFKKKLITTDTEIYKKIGSYYENILIYNSQITDSDIRKFMNYSIDFDNKILENEYSFDKWLDNFGI